MTHPAAALLLCNANLGACDNRPSQTGAEEVTAFVAGIALHRAEAELLDELLAEIQDDLRSVRKKTALATEWNSNVPS